MTTLTMRAWAIATLMAGPAPTLEEGIRLYNEGQLIEAATTLEAAIDALNKAAQPDTVKLVQAHIYRGAALVGLQHEDAAKMAFREALALQPSRRLVKNEFPDRVLRVFEAARTGQTESVMDRPPGTVTKAAKGTFDYIKFMWITLASLALAFIVEKSIDDGDAALPSLHPELAGVPQAGGARRFTIGFTIRP
jgi:tetratricopeptide (TPR) repeat protein